jgi:cobalt-precorrin 5A hydrolase/precorrin-3B C17-methyltransferase
MNMGTATIIVLNENTVPLARRIADAIPGCQIHGLQSRVSGVDAAFTNTIDHLQSLFLRANPIIGICAAGILIRGLAPIIADKRHDPAVLAIAHDGSAVVPLLGGHHGANQLARKIADILDITPAITTASDLAFGCALDDPPDGYQLSNPENLKQFTADLLAGEEVTLNGKATWISDSSLPLKDTAELRISVTENSLNGTPNHLVYHSETLVLGVGCERGCAPEELANLVTACLADANLSAAAIATVVSLDLKCDEAAVTALGHALNRPVRYFDATRLEQETPRLPNPSEHVFLAVGCHGVAEASALAAAGSNGTLIVEKQKSARATCAIAKAQHIIDANSVGRAKGSLAVVGLGPGTPDWRTGEAHSLLAQATDIVGYGGYLALLDNVASHINLHEFPLGAETERAEAALDMAAQGKTVALISSGDPGIYAMATLVFELLDQRPKPEWKWVDVTVSPGISALQAAAARIGAPLGHDFCAISLSDLLTPWTVIENRLQAAAEGDFVLALYNPASLKRRDQLVRALEILSEHRPPNTPVIAARHLGRPEETVIVHAFNEFDPASIDMSTLVLIGSSETRCIDGAAGTNESVRPRWVYTPRGYGDKAPNREKAVS